jgi:hypothetical protein
MNIDADADANADLGNQEERLEVDQEGCPGFEVRVDRPGREGGEEAAAAHHALGGDGEEGLAVDVELVAQVLGDAHAWRHGPV